MFQGVTSEKSNRYWDYRNGGVCEKYIFHTQNLCLSALGTNLLCIKNVRRILCRALIGAPIGLAISTAITIFSSLIYGDGNYYPVVPALVEQCGNEINAVVAQMIASLLYGAVWAGASVIWEMDDWSLLRQTVTHLLAGSIATFPVAYLMYWMKHSIAGVVVYFAIFIGIYVGIWITLYSRAKREVTKLNEKVSLQNR